MTMHSKIDLSKVPLTKKRAVEAVNAGQVLLELPEDQRVKSFENVQAATTAVQAMQASLREKFGHAELFQDDQGGAISWATSVEQEPEQKAPAQPQAATATGEKKPAVGKTNIDMSQRLHVLKDNPKRPETKAHKIFACYYGEPTGDDFVKAVEVLGFSRGDALANIHYDLGKGFIRIGHETTPQERANEEGATIDEKADPTETQHAAAAE